MSSFKSQSMLWDMIFKVWFKKHGALENVTVEEAGNGRPHTTGQNEFLSSPPSSDRLLDQPSLLSNG
jgi:hypothetical protein